MDFTEADSGAAPAFVRAGEPDLLVHLAWGGLDNFRALAHFEHELPLHYRFLRAMVTTGLPRLLVAGTCLEYGMQSGALVEGADTRPVCAYGLAKDTLRRQLELLCRVHPFQLTWARLFYLYGEGQADRALWPSLRRAAESRADSFAMSPGDQLRDYLHASDAAAMLARLTQLESGGGTVNVCSGKPIAVRSLVESWLKQHCWRLQLDLGAYPYADYEPLAFWGDRRKFDALLQTVPPPFLLTERKT
jgi:nucleoside-diphosphate-sugar epimerase